MLFFSAFPRKMNEMHWKSDDETKWNNVSCRHASLDSGSAHCVCEGFRMQNMSVFVELRMNSHATPCWERRWMPRMPSSIPETLFQNWPFRILVYFEMERQGNTVAVFQSSVSKHRVQEWRFVSRVVGIRVAWAQLVSALTTHCTINNNGFGGNLIRKNGRYLWHATLIDL